MKRPENAQVVRKKRKNCVEKFAKISRKMRGRVSLLAVTAGLNLGETRDHLQMTQHLKYSREEDRKKKLSADVARRFCDHRR